MASENRISNLQKFQWQPTISKERPRREMYVVVVGESSRSGNWGRYGYSRKTDPLTSADTALLGFANVTSGSNLTTLSMPQLFTLTPPWQPEVFDTVSSVITCFRQAGFKTWWISAQGVFGTGDSKPSMIGKEADVWKFLSIDLDPRGLYDSRLLPLLDSALEDSFSRKLIVLHTQGSHFDYRNRYPEEFRVFGSDSGKSWEHDSYDNSVLYTDWIIHQALVKMRKSSDPSAFLFISDHGEALGEGGASQPREPKSSESGI